jgi:hypothetical protein
MATKRKHKSRPKVVTIKFPGETEQQYLAWLLYCEAGSLQKLLRMWTGIRQGFGEVSSEIASRLDDPPTIRTLQNWSVKYQWVKRSELKLEEDLLALREETKRIATIRKHKIAEAFKRSIDLKIKQLRKGESVATGDVKALWEMFRTEMGLSTSKTEISHKINEDEQKPPTPEEDELGKEIDQAIKNYYDKKRRPAKK